MGVKTIKKTILATLLLIFLTGCWNTGKGLHVGYITAVETEGIIWQTGNAYIKTNYESTQEDIYCITNQQVYEQLRTFAEQKNNVQLNFHNELMTAPWRCATNTIIDSVTQVK